MSLGGFYQLPSWYYVRPRLVYCVCRRLLLMFAAANGFAEGENLDTQTMLSAIEDYVIRERGRRGIQRVDTTAKSEMSGEAFDEFVMLLERQLMTTTIGHGSWSELKHVEVLEGVYRLVEHRLSEVRAR